MQGTQEEGQQVRVDISSEQRRESELRDAIRAQGDERAEMNRRAEKLEGTYIGGPQIKKERERC